jgi:hypothetical protein
MLDDLRDGLVTCVDEWVSQHFGNSLQEKFIGGRCEGRNCLNPVTIGHNISRDQVSFSGTVRHTMAPGGRWENYK